jgi:hypothetical protein
MSIPVDIAEVSSVWDLVRLLAQQVETSYPDIRNEPLLARIAYEDRLIVPADVRLLAEGLGFDDDPRQPLEILLETTAEQVAMAFSYDGRDGAEAFLKETINHWAEGVLAPIGAIGHRQRLSPLADGMLRS